MKFLDFLFNQRIIDEKQKEQVLEFIETVQLDSEIQNMYDPDFLPESDLKHAQLIVNFGFIPIDSVSDLLRDFINSMSFEEIAFDIYEDELSDFFIDGYLGFIESTLEKMYGAKSSHGKFKEISSFEREWFVSQDICDDSEKYYVRTGLYSDFEIIRKMADDYNELIANKYSTEKPTPSDENVIDFCCELLNNINGCCTYKYNVDFNLMLPFYSKNICIEASPLYKIKFTIKSHEIYFFVIFGKDYAFCEDIKNPY